jgi:anti-sigma regulatory factor (Ser/Thr protein kinase)
MKEARCISAVYAESPAYARAHIRSVLAGASAETVEVAALLTSELVTNAIVHGSGDAAVIVVADNGRLRIEVHDGDATINLEPHISTL